MKRIYLLPAAVIVILIAANIYYFLNIYHQQINFQKTILARQSENCSREIEQQVTLLMNEIYFVLDAEDIYLFFDDPDVRINSKKKIEVFLSKYYNLVTEITLSDNHKNILYIFRDQKNNLITDIYLSRSQKELADNKAVIEADRKTLFIIPYVKGNHVFANLEIKIDKCKYIESVFNNYHIDHTLYQWILNEEGEIFFSNFNSGISGLGAIEKIVESQPEQGGSLRHELITEDGIKRVISAYYPVQLLDKKMLVVFSLDSSIVITYIINSFLTISSVTFFFLLLVIVYLLYSVYNERGEKLKSRTSELYVKYILANLPVGILVKGTDMKIKMINNTALDLLKTGTADEVIGKDISGMFFLSSDYLKNETEKSEGEFIYYNNDESEIHLYKKEVPAVYLDEEVIVEAFMDISNINQNRKNEITISEAKTEFLNKISFNIRNSLNGVINLTNALENETVESAGKNKIGIIRECFDEILSVISDINHFSDFEAGHIRVNEIPFVLKDEIDLTVDSLIKKAGEKNIRLDANITADTPENLIGDPDNLRQILTTLIDNSLKYTKEGEIKLTVTLKRRIEESILLEFILEDTGTGISPSILQRIKEISTNPKLISSGFGLIKTSQLLHLMKGEMHIESPAFPLPSKWGPGTRIRFYMQFFSDEKPEKEIDFSYIKRYNEICALILAEPQETDTTVQKLIKQYGILYESTFFNDSTADFIKSKSIFSDVGYSIIIIIDSPKSNGFMIARSLFNNNLHRNNLVVIVSSVKKPGNIIKSRRLGVDHYLTEPSELFNIIQDHFSNITIPLSANTLPGNVRSGLRILVAEDNRVNQIVARSMFKSLGYEIDLADNGKEAIDMIRKTDYDIVFLDINMPVKNGIDAAYELRKLGYTMPVVAITANTGESVKTQAVQAGMNDFIAKPVQIESLKNILTRKFSV
jgi:CheY-like chemotaxis protein/signal transduction histidine kinase